MTNREKLIKKMKAMTPKRLAAYLSEKVSDELSDKICKQCLNQGEQREMCDRAAQPEELPQKTIRLAAGGSVLTDCLSSNEMLT